MEAKKPYNNQQSLINDHAELNQMGLIAHSNPAQHQLRTTQHKIIQNKQLTNTMVYCQPKDQYLNANVQYMNKAWEPVQMESKKRVSSPGSRQLKFPSTKRPPESVVTMQGWLHKQGSDGLKVWRKRWFVLSDYCLFYYKGPEEEKVLGSILMPSYKVSLCSSDDKVGRKFAFKCEHANMRTYYLAADSHEIMTEWVEALNMACMLQSNVEVDRQSGPSVSSMYNASLDNSDSGFHQQYPHAHTHLPHTYPKHPQHSHSQSHSPANCCPATQPLYANAPPKPRRQNDGGYSSPSQDLSHEVYSTPPSSNNTLGYQNTPLQHYNAALQHSCSRSPVNVLYRNCDNVPLQQYVNHNQIQSQKVHSIYHHPQHPHVETNIIQNNERRTPDTYGRSKLNSGKNKDTSDYEDIYSDEVMYKRPLSPIAYSNIKKISPVATIPMQPVHRPYTLFATAGPQKQNFAHSNNTQMGRQPDRILPNVVPRPHSADFLEFELKQRNNANMVPVNLQQPRPKSSLDISQSASDSYYYSKESYADKMRKSSLYLQHYPVAHRYIKPTETHPRTSRQPMKIGMIPKSNTQQYISSDINDAHTMMRENSTPDICNSTYNKHSASQDEYETLHCKRDYSDSRLRDYNDQYSRDSGSVHGWNDKAVQHNDRVSANRDGERRREESMKRLLEWKQRMLQSPLNSKVPSLLHQPDLMGYSSKQYTTLPHSHSRLPQYNSYSSDDEENVVNRSRKEKVVRNKLLQAGWTKEGQVDKFLITPSPVLTDTTTLSNIDLPPLSSYSLRASEDSLFTKTSDLHTVADTSTSLDWPKENKSITTSSKVSLSSNSSCTQLEVPLTPTTIEDAQIDEELNINISCIDSQVETTPKPSPNIVEENYLPMTPKKSILDPTYLRPAKSLESEENAYMEMCRGLGASLLEAKDMPANSTIIDFQNCNNDHDQYEVFSFGEGKIEPVYMEVSHSSTTSIIEKDEKNDEDNKSDLPDILSKSQKNLSLNSQDAKSDSESADADDEASKDLDSLDAPFHPRFSLSDTFRPASYYLGASQVFTEFHDSSDSELVSPPPIPTSPPLTDELDNSFSFRHASATDYYTMANIRDFKEQENSDLDSVSNTERTQYSKKVGYLSADNLKQQDSSNSLYNLDSGRNSGNRSFNNSDSDVELRGRNSYYERMLKCRPVSEEFYDELESLDSTFTKTADSLEVDNYIKDLEIDAVNTCSKTSSVNSLTKKVKVGAKGAYADSSIPTHDYENMCLKKSDSKLSTELRIYPNHSTDSFSNNSILNQSSDSYSFNGASHDFVQRLCPETSSALTLSGEIIGLLGVSSPRSTPSLRTNSSLSVLEMEVNKYNCVDGLTSSQSSAPYYCSDISVDGRSSVVNSRCLLMNNQRAILSVKESKKDITRIVNPIRNSSGMQFDLKPDNTFKLAAEARSVSVDFLNLADKVGQIDKKNIYESDTLKRTKALDSANSLLSNPETVNLCPSYTVDKTCDNIEGKSLVRRSSSLDGILETVLSESSGAQMPFCRRNEQRNSFGSSTSATHDIATGISNEPTPDVWEEDTLWRDRLRVASQRHTRSLDGLDDIGNNTSTKKHSKKQCKKKLTRDVTYVNDNVVHLINIRGKQKEKDSLKDNDQDKKENSSPNKCSDSMKSQPNFLIDRETLRQWDLLSSAPSDVTASSSIRGPTAIAGGNPANHKSIDNSSVVEIDKVQGKGGKELTVIPVQHIDSRIQQAASGSISLGTHDTFPRDINKRTPPSHHGYYTVAGSRDSEVFMAPSNMLQENPNISGSHYDINDMNQYNMARKERQWGDSERMNVSAGELLGRTHEELVLLLIQLRRQSTNSCHAIEQCYQEIDNIQLQLSGMDAQRRLENLKKLEQLKQHLLELEKQYEKGKPLVNLVDNMVKLGSLYRGPSDHSIGSYMRDRLEFNQQMQEKRLLAEERRDWNRLSPNHMKLQAKVQQLYQLDKLLQEESETLQGLQHDKEKIERALGNIRYRLNLSQHNPKELEQARKQQYLLEKELSKVHHMLALNSKKLEETVAGNARLEQELLVLRQKLQMSKQHRNSPQFSNAGDSLPCAAGTSTMLENELHRVQQLVGDLQRQRQELSLQVRQLTDRSHTLTQQMYMPSTSPVPSLHSVHCANSKKRTQTFWRETDLDTMQNMDHGADLDSQNKSRPTTPLYIEEKNDYHYYARPHEYHRQQNEESQNIGNLQEKQEIKTVRIVKRESERRQRDREKTGNYSAVETQQKWESLLEEVDQPTNPFHAPVHDNETINSHPVITDHMLNYFSPVDSSNAVLNRETSVSSPSLPLQTKSYKSHSTSSNSINLDKSPVLSPVFKSKAARQIINEMSGQQNDEPTVKCSVRRLIPKEKRRHYTAPHNSLIKSMQQIASDDDMFSGLENGRRRARDDLDMERALRQRTDTPDVVRSTLSNKELKYNENTIENLLGTPNKISIPERYIPEKLPQLSPEEQQHRLRKVESIKKMLSDTTILRSVSSTSQSKSNEQIDKPDQTTTTKATSKIVEEKRQREHLLQLNQILAKQVMEMSKIVAVKALATLPLERQKVSVEEDDLSPVTPLPIYQQRDNFYS